MNRPRAAILTVGTEITDGQILDRNSAWISQRLVSSGIDTVEHRAVPDERELLRAALNDLRKRCEFLFVTGGLGPTSDDFTRDLIAEVFQRPLEFDEGSWKHVTDRLTSRGVPVRESQRQQCYFPRGSLVLTNSAGTANAFTFADQALSVYVLPGPPPEIAAVWEAHIEARLTSLVPESARERLFIWRCMGKGESEFADITETAMSGLGLRLGYRAHVPYVEIKVWVPMKDLKRLAPRLEEFEAQIRPWLINRDEDDLADNVLRWLESGGRLRIADAATRGLMAERLQTRIRDTKRSEASLALELNQNFSLPEDPRAWTRAQVHGVGPAAIHVAVAPLLDRKAWSVAIAKNGTLREQDVDSHFNIGPLAERSRKLIVEKTLLLLSEALERP